VGVAGGHRRRGIARRLLGALLAHADALGCREAWVLTERDNLPAMALYESTGGREAPDDVVMFSFGVGD
jgi:aminoglycoside 6'-N-acetyltransferase I